MTSLPRNRSDDISGLVKALAAAQGEIKDIARNRTVTVATRTGGSYTFKYATLNVIIDAIRGPLSKHGIAFTQTTDWSDQYNGYVLTTTLHWENQWIASYVIVGAGQYQEFGSGMTYMKRYALAALVGVAPDEDDDGNLADGHQVQAMQETDKSPAPPAPNPLAPQTPVAEPEVTFSTEMIKPFMKDGKGDWMEWGRSFMVQARLAPSNTALEELSTNNHNLLMAMGQEAPKLYRNLMTAVAALNPGFEDAQ